MEENKIVFLWNENIGKADLSEYTHIRVYHACRPIDIKEYLENGIHTFSKAEAYIKVKERLRRIGINEKKIEKVFNEHWENDIHHFNKICVNISKAELLNESGHYLVYGSEFICGMAVDLFCQQKLKDIGVPTLFECHIDKRKIPLEVIQFIEDDEMAVGSWDGGIYLHDDISADEIVSYTYPREIYDPLLNCTYRYTKF